MKRLRTRALAALRARHPNLSVELHALPLPADAPARGFVAAFESPHAALAPANALGRRVASGLAAREDEALVRTLGEVEERWSACFHDDADERRASARELGTDAVPLDRLLLVSERQREWAPLWNLRHAGRHGIEPALPGDARIGWCTPDPAFSTSAALVPAGVVKLGHPDRRIAPVLRATSAGVAHAGTRQAAVLRATLECVEHDAVSIWWHQRLRRPSLRVGTRFVGDVRAWLRGRRRTLAFLDLTHDLGVAVAAAVSTTENGGWPVVGVAAALDAAAAAEAALREMLLGLVNLARLDATFATKGVAPFDPDTAAQIVWHRAETLDSAPWLAPDDNALPAPKRGPRDFRELVDRLEEAGLALHAFDLTRPGAPGAVYRAVVPGLRPTLARFAPGRLYDVPVSLGWRDAPAAEGELNLEPYPG